MTAEIVSAIAANRALEDVLAAAVETTGSALGVTECVMYDYSPEDESVTARHLWSVDRTTADDAYIGTVITLQEWPTLKRVLHDGEAAETRLGDPALSSYDAATMAHWNEKSCLLVPLLIGKTPIGLLELVEKRHERLFSEADREFASTLAALSAVAIGNARSRQAQEQQNEALRQTEEKREAYVSFLECMDKVDRAIRRHTDADQMLQSVVATVFSLFGCDRAWLFYPCDPDAEFFRVPVEVCRPEYPGAGTLSVDVPMHPSMAQDLRDALASDDPVTYMNGTERPVNTLTAEQFGVQSQMFLAIYPKIGKPWVFGMHQCSHRRTWTQDEQQRFKEIGRRVADGLSSVLLFREMRMKEEKLAAAAGEWRTTFDAMSDSVALLDADGRILRCNAATAAFTGGDYESIIGRRCHEVFHGTQGWHGACPQVRARASLSSETAVFLQDDRWLRDTFQPMADAAGRHAGGVHVVSDITELKQAEEGLRSSLVQLQAVTEEAIAAIAAIAEVRDPYTAGHERRVSQLAAAIAAHMGLGEEEVTGVRVAGLLHDVGKMTVPAEILTKPGRLNDLEFELIRTHPQATYDVLHGIEFPWPVARAALQHHERLDGSGYPQGLTDGGITREARILAVADVVEAMSSHRPYRAALGIDEALAEIETNRGRLYDPQVVDACVELFHDESFAFD